MIPPSIQSRRLSLVSLSAAWIRGALEDDLCLWDMVEPVEAPPGWAGEEEWLLRIRLQDLERDPSSRPWLLRAILLGGEMAGHVGFHAPPDHDGVVEIGYSVLAPHRRRGIATEAVGAMLGWARVERGVRRFRASVAPTNIASLAVVNRFGFVRVGRRWDDRDGEELVFELTSGR